MSPKRILITAALPYANGPLHFGHIAGCYLPADAHARFQRMQGVDVAYICGSDEYGVAITLSAEQEGRTPQEHVDLYHRINSDFFKKLNISFDHYSRTTSDIHAQTTQEIFLTLHKNGCIEQKETEQLFSVDDNRFLADRYVIGTCPKCGHPDARGDECTACGASYEATDLKDPRSKLTNAPLTRKKTTHWFMRFDQFKKQLQEWIKDKPWKNNVLKFAQRYIDDLKPRAITRDSEWGIPVPLPDAPGKVLYVWFDAPIGYISMMQEYKPDTWRDYWLDPDTELVQFVGKDNIPFHAIFFPAMLMGTELPYKLVDDLPANEFLQLEGKQFSKSAGWTIDLERFFQNFTADQIRYVLAANAPEAQDSEFTWCDFQTRCNSELVGKFGNFANRSLIFCRKNISENVPEVPGDQAFIEKCHELLFQIKEAYAQYHLRKASQLIMELAQTGNVYFDHKQPWKDKQSDETKTVLYSCLECLKCLAIASYPIMPEAATKLWHLLGYTDEIATWDHPPIPTGQKLPEPTVLFQKIDDELIESEEEILNTTKSAR